QFITLSPNIDETPLANEKANNCSERLAIAKARIIAKTQTNALVIGSDQVAECDGQRLSKPGNIDNAIAQLTFASGKLAQFYTGVCVWNTDSGRWRSEVVETKVRFRSLKQSEIKRYVETEDVLGCAGSAKSEGLGIALLESISGSDPTALVGLPLITVATMLREYGVRLP
ncbi:MAG: Maf family nucleotide pyrophosphatase, partial [Burkholderiales bacterium]|nr:Maf family nucleotide pyrophosphatase [Burkholderiales bacterium]